ncbi:MAG TPA: Mur ligase family protein [Thermomicrobiales bacterium]|jgi:cyanophycin synthetase|nr:Mur ligase family protein [Thermomicrobiales bacterium]
MRLVEIRELEGPNPYLPVPAIRIAIDISGDQVSEAWLDRILAVPGGDAFALPDVPPADERRQRAATVLATAIQAVHALSSLDEPPTLAIEYGDEPEALSVSFPWGSRRIGLALAEAALALTRHAAGERLGEADAARLDAINESLYTGTATDDAEDAPELVHVGDDGPKVIAITATNGKTTTTRLVSHLLRGAGSRVGWSSTAGVFVDGRPIVTGDWSGPAGARRLLSRKDLDWAVLETARGGILRRGLAFDAAHVTAFINVSADHLGDNGITSLDTLAHVKGTVVRATRPDGWAILNADDPRVLAQRDNVPGSVCLTSLDAESAPIREHNSAGGRSVVVRDGAIVLIEPEGSTEIAPLAQVPLTFNGAARHMVENVLVAVGIALACGLAAEQIAPGLASFVSDATLNPGRLNTYSVGETTVLADYAHNEAGLAELIALARTLVRGEGRLWLVIASAGDRTDDTFRRLGRIAAEASDYVIPTDTRNYLRGRAEGEMPALMAEGIRAGGKEPFMTADDAITAIDHALGATRSGDVIAVMAVNDPDAVGQHLGRLAGTSSASE